MLFVAAPDQELTGFMVSIPSLLTAWCFGLRGAAIGTSLTLPAHIGGSVLGGLTVAEIVEPAMLIGHVFTAGVAFVVGWLRTLQDRLRRETTLRLASEQARLQAEMESQMLRADRLATVGTMAAGVAHEVNNPLTYLLTNVELLEDELGVARASEARDALDWSALDELLADISDGAQRISTIMGELKLFVHEHGETLEPVDIRAVAEASVKLTRHELGAKAVLIQAFEPVPEVLGNAGKLAQVFVNLIVNAVHAIPDEREDGRIEFGVQLDGDAVVVSVRDNGAGMSEQTRARAFEPFFTTKPVGVGTGLGLAVCASIIRQHRGELEVDTELGRGTCFRVRFPLADDGAQTSRLRAVS